jgi:hypothetical protein
VLTRCTEGQAIARAIDWTQYDTLKAQGLPDREIARQWGISWGTFHREKQKRAGADRTSPEVQEKPTTAHPSTPALRRRHTPVHRSTPSTHPTTVHLSTPAPQSTQAHSGVPMPNDATMRLLSLLPDLEVMVARERDRQRLLSTPIGTPRHTVKKTYVVDTLYVDLIDRYAQAEGVELKDVVNLAFHEFFERRHYLPGEQP